MAICIMQFCNVCNYALHLISSTTFFNELCNVQLCICGFANTEISEIFGLFRRFLGIFGFSNTDVGIGVGFKNIRYWFGFSVYRPMTSKEDPFGDEKCVILTFGGVLS